jgi:hypothetical protein
LRSSICRARQLPKVSDIILERTISMGVTIG